MISVCVAASMAAAPIYAQAETAGYPDIYDRPLEFESLTDFALAQDGSAAFAVGNGITLLKNGETQVIEFGSAVTDVDLCEADGNWYYALEGKEGIFALGADALPPEGYSLQKNDPTFFCFGDYYYTIDSNTGALFIDQAIDAPRQTVSDGVYSKLKIYQNKLYVLKNIDGQSPRAAVCSVEGTTVTELGLMWSNYSLLTGVGENGVAQTLKEYFTEPSVTTVAAATTVTEVNLEGLEPNGTFDVGDPKASTQIWQEPKQALLLATAENLALVSVGGKAYILNSARTEGKIVLPFGAAESSAATVNADDYAYSAPFMCGATKLFKIEAGEQVTVVNKLSADGVLGHDYYVVEKTAQDGTKLAGYVAGNFLEPAEGGTANEGGSTPLPDPDPHYDSNARTVILVVTVVLLVLIAAGYITWVCTVKRPDDGQNNDDNNK